MPEVTITLSIQIPEGATIAIANDVDTPLPADTGDEHDSALRWMERHAPAPQHALLSELLHRLRQEFGLAGSPPATGSRPYLNFYPQARYGTARAGALVLGSSRFYATLDPQLAEEFPGSEPAEGRYLTCYIKDAEDIELALSMMRRVLRDRGWTSND